MGSEKDSSRLFGNVLFPKIFQTFRMAIQPGKLIIAFSALAIICLAGWIMDFSKTVVATPDVQATTTELQIYMDSPEQCTARLTAVQSYIEKYKEAGERRGVFSTLWRFSAARFHGALNSLFTFNLPGVAANIADWFNAVGWAIRYHFLYCIIFFAIGLAAISVAGGSL
ncbi:MAG TPA: hypothetical protein ENH43_03370, partial [Phycisphaerales bacterium]|nr:hypothetical protein [Phycisphaerales bacterium]